MRRRDLDLAIQPASLLFYLHQVQMGLSTACTLSIGTLAKYRESKLLGAFPANQICPARIRWRPGNDRGMDRPPLSVASMLAGAT
jgi:hypothetical protein